MKLERHAAVLGRLGGIARARALTPERRREIASRGGLSRSLSRHGARRIRENFAALEAVRALRNLRTDRGG